MISIIRYIEVIDKVLRIKDEKRKILFEKPIDTNFQVELKFNDVIVENKDYKDTFVFDKIQRENLLNLSSVILYISPESELILKDTETKEEFKLTLPKYIIEKLRGSQLSI